MTFKIIIIIIITIINKINNAYSIEQVVELKYEKLNEFTIFLGRIWNSLPCNIGDINITIKLIFFFSDCLLILYVQSARRIL